MLRFNNLLSMLHEIQLLSIELSQAQLLCFQFSQIVRLLISCY